MKAAAVTAGVLAGGFVLLAIGFGFGARFYFFWADYRARRREAHERTTS